MFRDLRYITENALLSILDGYIEVTWWVLLKLAWKNSTQNSLFNIFFAQPKVKADYESMPMVLNIMCLIIRMRTMLWSNCEGSERAWS